MKTNKFFLVSVLVIVTALFRLIPFVDNFNPFASIALFGSAMYSKKIWKYAVPLLAIYVSDFLINNLVLNSFFNAQSGLIFFSDYMVTVYLSYAMIVLFGSHWFKKINAGRILGGALVSTVIFFLITNFGAWIGPNSIYPQNFAGLMESYILAIPFSTMTLVSNLIFSFILFYSYAWITNRSLALQEVKA